MNHMLGTVLYIFFGEHICERYICVCECVCVCVCIHIYIPEVELLDQL